MTIGNLAGSTLANRYDLLALIGSGGMGAVYRAHDRELDEMVALKVINPERASDPQALVHFRQEVKLARRVTHRNIARTFELGADRGITYCTMELVAGESLSSRIKQGRLPVGETAAIAQGLCEGLAAAHAAGVIHRDIKPGNVLLAHDGRAMLVDFGIAAMHASQSVIAGTPGYMAPEQAYGEPPSPASDIYAVGVVLYEMLTGTRAFTGATLEVLIAKQEIEALVLPDGHAPRELADLISRATARDVARRIADADELAKALARWGSGTPLVAAAPAEGLPLREVIVLPPEGNASTMHVALGAHQALLDRLAVAPRLRVLPRSRVDQRVDAVVELRVTDALEIRVIRPTGTLRLDLPLAAEDLRSVAAAASAAIVAAVEESRVLVDHQLATATDLWLRARALIHQNVAAVVPALELLEQAHALAPEDARIAATLANVAARHTFFLPDVDDAILDRATELVKRTLATAPDEPDVHNAAALLELNIGDPAIAAYHFRTAITCARYSAEAHDGLGRMLLEAGHLDAGMARLSDACAIAPDLAAPRWSIARMYGLEGRWADCERTMEGLGQVGPRVVLDQRFAVWRGATAELARMRPTYVELVRPVQGPFADGIFAALLDGEWPAWRDRMIAAATASNRNRRRTSFLCQVVAEVAGYLGDQLTCGAAIAHAVEAGLFDLHWLERCPSLQTARELPAYRHLRAQVERRAGAVFDALYGDHEGVPTSATLVG